MRGHMHDISEKLWNSDNALYNLCNFKLATAKVAFFYQMAHALC